MMTLIIYMLIALSFSFLCSILEAVLLSVTPSYIAGLEESKPRLGAILRELKSNVDRPLAAILSLNTVAHTIGAAGVGAEAQRLWGSEILAVASAVLTLLILIISEIIPKTLGAVYWRRLGGFLAATLPPLIWIMMPLVWLSELITRTLKKTEKEQTFSREEFAALARIGVEQGVFDASESRILHNLLHFGSLRAKDVMTPRTVAFTLAESTTVEEAIAHRGTRVFSRIPIWHESVDNIRGYVLKDQLLLEGAQGQLQRKLEELARDALFVPATLPLPSLFEVLLDKREHIAVVVDEYGGFSGIVTMEDVLETMIGLEIVDEGDRVQDMRAMARAKWEARARRIGYVLDESNVVEGEPSAK